ncbi:MAG: glycerate kinase, partial [Campylobacterota bacterium]|nr:glycerate kinase [Campylobacterota bacterium]
MSNIETLKKIYFKAINAVKPQQVISQNISIDDKFIHIAKKKVALDSFKKLYIFGAGKASLGMAKECEKILGKKIAGGVVVSNQNAKLKRVKHITSTHPLLSQKSVDSADEIISEMQKMSKEDMFIFLLSGGASAMIEKPIDGLTLKDFQKISASLLTSGIDIKALNSVRKSISQIKGGKLAEHTTCKGVVLVLSDVIGNDLQTIGSAPLFNGETPHYIIGDNALALSKASKFIAPMVQKVKIVTTTLDMSSPKAATFISDKIKKYESKYESYSLLFGAETTTKVKGSGLGGRNQELALRLLLKECINEKTAILCAGSDGIDGNSKATGAF